MKSMTGYAQGEFSTKSMRFSLELKSYNNRFLEAYLQLPSPLSSLEPLVRQWLQERIGRGKVECSLRVREWLSPMSVTVDEGAAAAGIDALRRLSSLLGTGEEPKLSSLLQMDGVLDMERDIGAEEAWKELEPALAEVYRRYDASRDAEGSRLEADIRGQLSLIEEGVVAIRGSAPELERNIRENLRKRFQETLGDAVDEARVLQEIAVALMRFTINEELTRLSSHLQAMREAMKSNPQPGKVLDFLCQEMNREVNTIGSKSQLVETSGRVVALKEAVENIREQARNIV